MKEAGKLHDTVTRAPRMLVARADREAEALIQLRRGVEIADGMDDVIEARAIGASSSSRRLHQSPLRQCRLDERGEQRMRLERPRFQLGMELHADEPRMVFVFDDLRQDAVGDMPEKRRPCCSSRSL